MTISSMSSRHVCRGRIKVNLSFNELVALFYYDNPVCDDQKTIAPVVLECPDSCKSGEYIALSEEVEGLGYQAYCAKCPVNTFNPGSDVVLIDGKMGDFAFTGLKAGTRPLEM